MTSKTNASRTIGNFNAPTGDERPHVLVRVGGKNELVEIFELRENVDNRLKAVTRAQLTLLQWQSIAPSAEHAFNEYLREAGERPGRFRKTGETRLSINNLGKELLVLAWAIEDATAAEVEVIKASWQRLHRIERWWLYNQTVALNGDPRGRGKGWRAALRLMLGATPTGGESSEGDPSVTLRLMPTRATRTKSGKNDMEPMFHKASA